MRFIKGITVLCCLCAVLVGLPGCGGDDDDKGFEGAGFAVLSDPHIFDPSLLINDGVAFQTEMASDRKMLPESETLLQAVVAGIEQAGVQFVLIPGDLTKDGELVNFEWLAAQLAGLEAKGISVYVVPGNHDIDNPEAVAYDGSTVEPVDNVSSEGFATMFHDFGYGEALARDSNSLSYVAEPVRGLWLLALDSCKYDYEEGDTQERTGGAFSEETLAWIVEQLQKAQAQGKQVIAMMHHGLTEHFTGQSTLPGLGDEYVIDDWETVSQTLAEAGLKVVFTGHYHAQDITKASWAASGAFVFDVETGSVITYPNPCRVVTYGADGLLTITSTFLENVDVDTGGLTFQEYSKNFVETQLSFQAPVMLTGFGLSEEKALELTPYAVAAVTAHYHGDETPGAADLLTIQTLMQDPDPVVAQMGLLLGSFWTDLPPADNNVVIDLNTGEVL